MTHVADVRLDVDNPLTNTRELSSLSAHCICDLPEIACLRQQERTGIRYKKKLMSCLGLQGFTNSQNSTRTKLRSMDITKDIGQREMY
jgi:hypothetical protein